MRRRLPSTWLGPIGSSELHPKGASKPTPVRRLLIQLFNNLRRDTCRGEGAWAFKKRVAAPCSYLGPTGGPTALPTGFGLVSNCLQ